ncbi:MAG TPA: hypothetical protein VH816_02810 [Gaiellaceae bacterium]|jgi:hypothetical protein
MGRALAWLGGALGLAWLWRKLQPQPAPPVAAPEPDPAAELRERLEQAREAADDRDDFDAAEGQTLDEVGEPRSLEERRRAIHEQVQQTLGEMRDAERE